jgi:putative peptidoglycan lipid II flippase
MVACTIITLASLPVYSILFSRFSFVGLAAASDIGILANTLALALLLHSRGLVRWDGLPWGELAKVLLIAVIAAVLGYEAAQTIPRTIPMINTRWSDCLSLSLTTVTWMAAVAAGLWLTRSNLLKSLRKS